MFTDWLRKRTRTVDVSQVNGPVAETLLMALGGKCPRCGATLAGHSYQLFAIVVADRQNELLRDFIENAKGHHWEALSQFQKFDPSKNALEAYALRCTDSSLTLLLVRDPFELYDADSMEDFENLTVAESTSWSSSLRADRWEVFVKTPRRSEFYSSSSPETFRTARNASCGMSTWPTRFMRRLPSFCFSRSLRLREMSPP
jgi:hypothetical protein